MGANFGDRRHAEFFREKFDGETFNPEARGA
jgi:hypothetical protein